MSAGSRAARWAGVTAGYAGVTALLTWPLVRRLSTGIAGDLGDPVFVAWVMAWVDDHLAALLRGVPGAWEAMWQAPIFAPAPDALTFSEHFIGQALQALPVAWLGGDAVLAYNLVFLTTLVLTGVFTHGLAQRLTGSLLAAAAAGFLATFNDYRIAWSVSHLHTLSIHWWVAALWAIDVWVETGRRRALAAATAMLVMLHLSSNYLMAYCAPLTIGFGVWALARHGRLRDVRRWWGLAAAGLAATVAVLPILVRYLATASGLTAAATAGIAAANSATFQAYGREAGWLVPLLALASAGAVAPASIIPAQPAHPTMGPRWVRLTLLGLAATAFVLAMGPLIRIDGVPITGPYAWLASTIPGYAGLRVPHRFVAPGATLLALLAGAGALWASRRPAGWVAMAATVGLAARTVLTHPFPVSATLDAAPLVTPAADLSDRSPEAAFYRHLRTLPTDAVVVEFPFGHTVYELRYTYLTRVHGRRIANGYSGLLPARYLASRDALRDPPVDPESAWAAMAGATHAIVHTGAWHDDTGHRIRGWLEAAGARPLVGITGDWLYDLRGAVPRSSRRQSTAR